MTPLTNLSQAIRQDLEIFGNNGTHWSSDDINNAVNYWKNKLYEAFDGETVGNTIWVSTSTFFIQVTCMKAAWELGISVFNQEFSGAQGHDVVPALEDFYKFIKVKLVHTNFGVMDSHYKFIYLNEFDPCISYPARNYVLNKPIDENTVAVRTHTSGTTGMPRLIEYTHQQGIDRIHNLTKLHGFVESDVPAHYKILHHSSLFMDYALPLLSLCKTHHGLEGEYSVNAGESDDPLVFFNRVLPYMKEHKVTRFLCPYGWGNSMCQATHVDFKEMMSIYIMRVRTTGLVQDLFNTFNFKEISNGFGSSEFSLIAMNKVTKDTVGEFEVNKYSIINDAFEYELFPTHLRGRIKGDEWSTTSDIFTTDGKCLYFHGRNQKIAVDGKEIDVRILQQKIDEFFPGANFSLVADFELNQLYLACFDDLIPNEIEGINRTIVFTFNLPYYKISKMDRIDIKRILRGVKPSNPLLLYYFRTH